MPTAVAGRRLVHGWRRWSPGDRRVLLTCAALNPLVFVCLHVLGLRRTEALLARLARSRRPAPPDHLALARRIGTLCNRAAQPPAVPVPCLTRSLTTTALLARRGVASALRLGVRPDDGSPGTYTFHAWVEVDGVPVNDDPAVASVYLPFPAPADRRRG